MTSTNPAAPVRGAPTYLLLTLTATLAAACAIPGRPIEHAAASGTSLNASDVLTEVRTPHRELRRLDRLPASPYVRLRRDLVLVSTGATDRAVRDLNQILFGATPPTESVRALAHYVRAAAYERRNDVERARYDLEQASLLATDPTLRRRIEAELGAVQPAAPRVVHTRAAPLPRSAWHAVAGEAHSMTPMGSVHRVTVHHSAVLARPASQRAAAAAVRSIQRTHMEGNGWSDIGYHYLIDPAGRVWNGRPLRWQGAHAGDARRNRGNVGVCLLGNFVRGSDGQNPTPQQVVALQQLLDQLATDHGIGPDQIHTHRELKSTSCPGDRLQHLVDGMRNRMANALVAARESP